MALPIIPDIQPQNILINTNYEIEIIIPNATHVDVDGIYENFYHSWDRDTTKLTIGGNPIRIATNRLWIITARNEDMRADPKEVVYNVIPHIPIIGEVFQPIQFFRNRPNIVNIPIKNIEHAAAIAKSSILGFDSKKTETGIEITGEIPDDAVFSSSTGQLEVTATASSGSDIKNFLFEIIDLAADAPLLRLVSNTYNTATFAWSVFSDQSFTNFQYRLDSGEWIEMRNPEPKEYTISNLKPYTVYTLQIRGLTDGIPSGLSNIVSISTSDSVPDRIGIVYAGIIPGVPSKPLEVFIDIATEPDKISHITATILGG